MTITEEEFEQKVRQVRDEIGGRFFMNDLVHWDMKRCLDLYQIKMQIAFENREIEAYREAVLQLQHNRKSANKAEKVLREFEKHLDSELHKLIRSVDGLVFQDLIDWLYENMNTSMLEKLSNDVQKIIDLDNYDLLRAEILKLLKMYLHFSPKFESLVLEAGGAEWLNLVSKWGRDYLLLEESRQSLQLREKIEQESDFPERFALKLHYTSVLEKIMNQLFDSYAASLFKAFKDYLDDEHMNDFKLIVENNGGVEKHFDLIKLIRTRTDYLKIECYEYSSSQLHAICDCNAKSASSMYLKFLSCCDNEGAVQA